MHNIMTIRLIACDLDHTLIRSDRTIHPRDIAALERAREEGIYVTIATGRMFCASKHYAANLRLDVPIIAYQGSMIRCLQSNEELLHLTLPLEVAATAIRLGAEMDATVNIYIDDQLYVLADSEAVQLYAKHNDISVNIRPQLVEALFAPPTKVVFIEHNPHKMQRLISVTQECYGATCDVTHSLPHLLEVGHQQATKAQAVAFLAQHLGVKREQVMAIGDGLNDLDMLAYAGIGVAMGNASDIVKAQADWVTRDHNAAGVALALDKFVFGKTLYTGHERG